MKKVDILLSLEKDELPELAKTIDKNDISLLIELLNEKNDKIRYAAFLLLQNRSIYCNDVYLYWDTFNEKLKNENSYQRSLGAMLLAENVRWDSQNKINNSISSYLMLLNDEKPITIRQCIQSLNKIIPFKKHLHILIAAKLMSIEILDIKETMRKPILTDILGVLIEIRKYQTNNEIENYINKALLGGIIDKKTKKQIELLLQLTSNC
ncbi:hypothetical protein EHE19_008780 [Ruminiclostridium herbifermentans]|uniref:HEAT repeat domain-containing protein n=1 Tax=Ruminiclostridium herbifermentans TaxID=2488810 RepID=A0A4V6EP66_9FIRM|nr:hypothetical protein [Ruminiclostridium herbifermentans]QNU68474.1 hypothetical protein EHE19_008780 [Ruminiclostridium herbifermentans]